MALVKAYTEPSKQVHAGECKEKARHRWIMRDVVCQARHVGREEKEDTHTKSDVL